VAGQSCAHPRTALLDASQVVPGGALYEYRSGELRAACSKWRFWGVFQPQAIFAQTGRIWTSAGVTTGIDMALAMLEEDHGRALADAVASQLVLYVRRPGFQAQFSEALVAQAALSDPLAGALRWARAHLPEADVPGLAKRAGLSVRTLHRRCQELTGGTPRALLERLRVEHARMLMRRDKRRPSLKQVADRAGFRDVPQMNRAFQRTLGLLPRDVLLLFAESASPRA
jgi:transcriptional regulator GlxA family with amidase domain